MYDALEKKIRGMIPNLNEKQLRQYLGSEAKALGRGGIIEVIDRTVFVLLRRFLVVNF